MHDIKLIRENPTDYTYGWASRGLEIDVDTILSMDQMRREHIQRKEVLEKNRRVKELLLRASIPGTEAHTKVREELVQLREDIEAQDRLVDVQTSLLNSRLAELPNIPNQRAPLGTTELDNRHLTGWRPCPATKAFGFEPKDHIALGEALGMMEFDTAANMAGARFVVLRGPLARLERALGQFMLNYLVDKGFEEVSVPLLVNAKAMFGTGQLPKFEDDLFKTTDGRYLIPTAEVALTNLTAGKIFEVKDIGVPYEASGELGLAFAAVTPCFRSEAGSAGRDTRGMIRQHQFNKVEMVVIAHPTNSASCHAEMLQTATNILHELGLHYEVVELCTGDLGFSAMQTFDINVWLPSQKTYREISSVSNCGDFQARRLNARFREEAGAKPQFVHTLNGSGVAVGRALVAVMENYQNEDGSITVPDVLVPYMGGITKIAKA